MRDDTSGYTLVERAPPTARAAALLRELRRASHWFQLARFGAVGVSGYAINLAVFAGTIKAGLDYHAAAVVAFVVALANNFVWNRLWTFRGAPGSAHGQALRFVAVSVGAFLVSLGVLDALVRYAGMPKLAAQAIAVLAVTPLSFLANKLWSFRARAA